MQGEGRMLFLLIKVSQIRQKESRDPDEGERALWSLRTLQVPLPLPGQAVFCSQASGGQHLPSEERLTQPGPT